MGTGTDVALNGPFSHVILSDASQQWEKSAVRAVCTVEGACV